ncbi:YciI family protein [Desulfocurvus sp. DL9XJH121]
MFIVTLTYKAPLETVDAHLEAHRAFLRAQYDCGMFLASGPRNPRVGGVILARAESLEALMAVLAQDPFNSNQVADYDVTEFAPVMTCAELGFLRTA